jgi:hypothetical protein
MAVSRTLLLRNIIIKDLNAIYIFLRFLKKIIGLRDHAFPNSQISENMSEAIPLKALARWQVVSIAVVVRNIALLKEYATRSCRVALEEWSVHYYIDGTKGTINCLPIHLCTPKAGMFC